MAYATQSDLVPLRMTQKDLVELTDDAGTGEVNAAIVTAALDEASGRVESYCRNRYQTPLQTSEDVTALTLDIAQFLLFSRRRETRISDTVQQRFDQAISFLKDIAAGKASLDQPVTATAQQSSLAGPEYSQKDAHLVFREEHLKGFI